MSETPRTEVERLADAFKRISDAMTWTVEDEAALRRALGQIAKDAASSGDLLPLEQHSES